MRKKKFRSLNDTKLQLISAAVYEQLKTYGNFSSMDWYLNSLPCINSMHTQIA